MVLAVAQHVYSRLHIMMLITDLPESACAGSWTAITTSPSGMNQYMHMLFMVHLYVDSNTTGMVTVIVIRQSGRKHRCSCIKHAEHACHTERAHVRLH